MTLNLMLTSRSAVYLSGDFRLTYKPDVWKDNFDTQKLVPIFTYNWSALVSFAGIAQTSRGLDVGDWVSQQLASIDPNANFGELPMRLLTADSWLTRVRGNLPLTLSIVGFIGRRPVAMVISNYSDINGQVFNPLLPRLQKFEIRPKVPEVRMAGDTKAVRKADVDSLTSMMRQNRTPRAIEAAMAQVSASVADRSLTISQECVTGHLLPTGKAEVTPHGIDDRAEYVPAFVQRNLADQGMSGFVLKKDKNGKPLSPRWKGMTASQVQGPRRRDQAMGVIHAFANVEQIVGTPREGSQMFTKIAEENEPERVNFTIHWDGKPSGEDTTSSIEEIKAGEHVTHAFEPTFRYEIGEGWGYFFPETLDCFCIGIAPEKSSIILATPKTVFNPTNPSEQNAVPAPESADDWLSWFQKHPNLDTSEPVPVKVGGAAGVSIDVSVNTIPETSPQYCGSNPCVPLFDTSATPMVCFAAQVGHKDQFLTVDVDDKPVVVNVAAPTDAFDAFLNNAFEVLETVEWDALRGSRK